MPAEDRFLERTIKTVMQQRKLFDREELVYLSDAQILRCAGVGRKGLNAIRTRYPGKYGTPFNTFAESLIRADKIPKIGIGSIDDVVAMRVDSEAVLFRQKRSKELVPIWLTWSSDLEPQTFPTDQGFGRMPADIVIRRGPLLPHFTRVDHVELTRVLDNGDSWSGDLMISTVDAVFEIMINGEGKPPLRDG